MARSLGTELGQPLVSILIPVHNRVDLTRQCFESLLQHADSSIPTEFLVVDDCSTDETPAYLASLGKQIHVIRNEVRQCFGHNMNFAANEARGKYICLLNNDTLVTPGWLKRLVETVEQDAEIGVLGNRHLFPDSGKLNHAGMVFDESGKPTHLYPGLAADYPPALISREFQIVTAACWLVPRALFLQMGGFDEGFRNGFEDVDFCLRVRQKKLKVYYCANSVIYHYGQSSPGRTDNDAANEAYFRQKWEGQIKNDLQEYLRKDARLAAKSASATGRKRGAAPPADVHFAIPLHLANSFTWVTSQLALSLDDIGVGVSLKPGKIDPSVGPEATRRLHALMQRPPSPRVQIKWNHYWEPYLSEELAGEVNAEIFCTNYRYGPRRLQDIDHWMRHVVLNRHRKLALSGFCRDALTELGVPAEGCSVVPCGYSPEVHTAQGANNRYRRYGCVLLAVTNSHDPYRYGTDVLLRAYAKAFRPTEPVVLVLKDYGVGAERSQIAEWIAEHRNGPRIVHLLEFVSKDELIQLYRGADAFVAPFRGEGFGMKIIDALALGLPVVCPNYGGPADYLCDGAYFPIRFREGPVGECYDRLHAILPQCAQWAEVDEDDLAVQLQAVVRDRAEAERRGQTAQAFVRDHYSWKRAAEKFRDALLNFTKERDQTVAARQLSGSPERKISVIIPTYNRADALDRCLSAYREQSLPQKHWDIIVVDDGSTYDVRGLVEKHAQHLPIRFEANSRNAGPAQARNRGIELSAAEHVLFTGDDIIPDRDFLAEHLRAHTNHPQEAVGVLGYTSWHRDINVTPLMDYMTSEGGQQFSYDALTPNHWVAFGHFYTSNVSVKRSLLVAQEEMFSTRFPCAAFEDVELALRLARKGFRLWYHPRAHAGHLHPMTDQQAFQRQYKVGRMLVTYALLHPEQMAEEHRVFLRWLDVAQHLLLHQEDFQRTCGELSKYSESLQAWLDQLSATLHTLDMNLAPGNLTSLVGRNLMEAEGKQWRKQQRMLFAYHFDLMLRSGMADAWMGIGPEEPNPLRGLIRLQLSTGVWKLLSQGRPDSPLSFVPRSPGARLLRLARGLRHHRWLVPLFRPVSRLPGYRKLTGGIKRMLHTLP
ncbi:MAG TPA: glycosyltransferase [Gemmataceae bacterium]|nr:glycosyltransferase [Gemmataceae bacterium]